MGGEEEGEGGKDEQKSERKQRYIHVRTHNVKQSMITRYACAVSFMNRHASSHARSHETTQEVVNINNPLLHTV